MTKNLLGLRKPFLKRIKKYSKKPSLSGAQIEAQATLLGPKTQSIPRPEMQKSLEQARMLMKNIGVKNLGRKPASAGAKPKAEPKVETKPGEKRKRSKR